LDYSAPLEKGFKPFSLLRESGGGRQAAGKVRRERNRPRKEYLSTYLAPKHINQLRENRDSENSNIKYKEKASQLAL